MNTLQYRAMRALQAAGFSVYEARAALADTSKTRDTFAAEAMGAQIQFEGMEGCDKEHIAGMAYEIADAMMEMRGKI